MNTNPRPEPTESFNKVVRILYPAIVLTIVVGLFYGPVRNDASTAMSLMLALAVLIGALKIVETYIYK